MKYYAHFRHTDFVLCLGYKGDAIKKYFLNYDECLSNDFVLSQGGRQIDLLHKDIDDWKITFVDTGLSSNIGQRLKVVEPLVRNETIFLANYTDGLTDFPLPTLIEEFKARKAVGMFLCVRPNYSVHFVQRGADGRVLAVNDVVKANAWINGGYFVFSGEIFDYIRPGEELVEQPFKRLIDEGRLFGFEYSGFWRSLDTFKDLQALTNLLDSVRSPLQLWQDSAQSSAQTAGSRDRFAGSDGVVLHAESAQQIKVDR